MKLHFYLPDDYLRLLEHVAYRECRTVHQQAQWMLMRALDGEPEPHDRCAVEQEASAHATR